VSSIDEKTVKNLLVDKLGFSEEGADDAVTIGDRLGRGNGAAVLPVSVSAPISVQPNPDPDPEGAAPRRAKTGALANRISGVREVVATMEGRVGRIEASTPPSPVLPPSPIYPALIAVQDASGALLASSRALACALPTPEATTGGETIADDDSRAGDTSSEGIVEQLNAVATVLGQTNARLTGIAALVGQSPDTAEIDAAAAVWAQAAAIFNRTADLLANAVHTPRSPVCPAG
jgi:hypothetical protein